MPGERKHHTEKFRSCVEQVMAKGHEESSAYAICTTSLQDAGEEIYVAEATRNLHLLGATGQVSHEVHDGRDRLVVPVVALMEGVIHAINAETPEFISADILQQNPKKWDGHPIVLGHPAKNGKQVSAYENGVKTNAWFGTIRATQFKNNKLALEAVIDPERLKQLKQEKLLQRLEEGQPVEVSVGAYVRTNDKAGTFNGKRYSGEWLEMVPDHLAFLPNGYGACSLEMGCGTHRAAMRVCEDHLELDDPLSVIFSAVDRFLAVVKMMECPMCKGTGTAGKNPCEACDGNGELKVASLKTLIGARNSAKDAQLIQEMHDYTMMLGAKCDRSNYKMLEVPLKTIRHEGGRWAVYSKDGTRRLGMHNTEAEAIDHRRAIEEATLRRGLELQKTDVVLNGRCSCGGHR